MSKNSRKMQCS